MLRLMRTRSRKVGLPPGSLVYTGEAKADPVRIRVIDYSEERCDERELESIEESFSFRDTESVSWINIDGIHDPQMVEAVGQHFGLHSLLLEDVMSPRQRAKMEDYDNILFIVLRMLRYEGGTGEIRDEQLSIILGPRYVVTFQQQVGDVFEPLRERLRAGRGRLRKSGADYLAYALMDMIVDSYFLVLEAIGEQVEDLEDRVMHEPGSEVLPTLSTLRRELLFLRKSVWPLREVLSSLTRAESSVFTETTQIFCRDVYDHTIQVIDTVEALRDIVSGMFDTYLSSVSHRMNEVMKVLTIIATIFIPLTFIAGIYGMNFERMPELSWSWAYPTALGIMAAVAFVMVLYFRRKRWL